MSILYADAQALAGARKIEAKYKRWIWAIVPFAAVLGFFTHPSMVEALSTIMLLVIAGVCFLIFTVRRERRQSILKAVSRIWVLIALGFVFLAADETFSIHEQLDVYIHQIFNLEETALSDRLDDILILGYGIAGLAIMVLHRHEFVSLPASFPYLALGFVFLIVMVAIDAATNRDDVLTALSFDKDTIKALSKHFALAEEIAKMIAEVLFLLGFVRIYGLFVWDKQHPVVKS